MEETGSNGLDAMIVAQRDTFFSSVDYIIISDCGWLSRRPALTYGTRGNCYFYAEVVQLHAHTRQTTSAMTKENIADSMLRRAFLQVDGPKQDLHSGVYGGAVIEPMTDLIGILGECFSKRDNVQSLSPSQKGKTQTKEQLGLGNMPGNVSILLNLKS